MKQLFTTEKLTVVATLGVLITLNISELWLPGFTGWIAITLAIMLMLFITKKGGLELKDLGLSRSTIVSGLNWGAGIALIILLFMAAAFFIDKQVFLDNRYQNNLASAAYLALFVIPLHTVIIEELAFRGLLLASLGRVTSTIAATMLSSALFGLWHIIPSLHLDKSSSAIGGIVGAGSGANVLVIAGTVLVTAVAGAGLCEIRKRSGSLIAPIIAHWAINGMAVMFAALSWAK